VEHDIFGRQNKITATTRNTNGQLNFKHGSPLKFKGDRDGDIVDLATILRAGGVNSLDVDSGENDDATFRYDGVLLMMVVDYGNDGYSTSKLKYEYSVIQIPGVSVIAQQPGQFITPTSYSQRTWYGIRVIFLLTGTIGKFDFPTLLTALVNGMVLVKLATTVVDILLLYVMPDKALYSKHKFELTEDFSDVRLQQKSASQLSVRSGGES